MEQISKIILITFLCMILAIFQYWSIALIIAIVCLGLSMIKRLNGLIHVLPIVCYLFAYVVHDYVLMAVWLFLLYASRLLVKDKSLQGLKNGLCLFLIIIATHIILPQITVIAVILWIFTLPICNFSQYKLSNKLIVIACSLITIIWLGLTYFTYYMNHNKRECAYMNHGVWCKPYPEYKLEGLSNSSAYSYSELCKILDADILNSMQAINQYNELWIMTPTKPFTDAEMKEIRKWVRNGGHLIVGTDHTDLYGHARVANALLKNFGCKVSYASVFETNKSSYFANALSNLCPLKTPNSIDKMTFGFPLLSIFAWKERAYYSNDNFFGPMAANGNNTFDIQNIVSTRHYGLGRVTIVADTTFCANFAVYQPYVRDFIEFIVSYHVEAIIILILPLLYLLIILVGNENKFINVSVCLCLIPLSVSSLNSRKIVQDANVQIWTGDRTFVSENICPFACVSTAYSLSALSGKVPYWKDDVDENIEDVIWVDSVPPKNPKWRWLHITDNHQGFYEDGSYCKEFDVLYKNIGALKVCSYEPAFYDFREIKPECIFNDAVMNDWWYGNFGLSEIRKQRITAWIHWLQKDKTYPPYTSFNRSQFTEELHPAILKIKGSSPVRIELPRPIDTKEEVNFGCGIVGKIIQQSKDTTKIIGLHEFSENWDCPQIWTLTFVK